MGEKAYDTLQILKPGIPCQKTKKGVVADLRNGEQQQKHHASIHAAKKIFPPGGKIWKMAEKARKGGERREINPQRRGF